MRQLTAFIQKEFTEVMRNSKLLICAIIFILLGIMNPAIAKITPYKGSARFNTVIPSVPAAFEIKKVSAMI